MDKHDVENLRVLVSTHVEDMDSKRVLLDAINELHAQTIYMGYVDARISLLEKQITSLSNYVLASAGECLKRFEEEEKATKSFLKKYKLNERLKEYGKKIQHRLVD